MGVKSKTMADTKTDETTEEKVDGVEETKDETTEESSEETTEEDDSSTEDVEEKEITEDDVPVRNSSNAQNIITRQKKTIDKLRKKDGDDEEVGDEGGDKLTPDAEELINSKVEEGLAPFKKQLVDTTDGEELKQLYVEEPEAKKFEKAIKVYANHPNWKGVPIVAIYHHLAYKQTLALGAKKKKNADAEAEMSGAGGHSRRPIGGALPSAEAIDKMTDKEIGEMQHKIMSGQM